MQNWIFSTIIPIAMIVTSVAVFKPTEFRQTVKVLNRVLMYLLTYTLLIYFLDVEDVITTTWAYNTLVFFFFVYLAIVITLNLMDWITKRD
ncbi:hypothetical protein [Dyadobacter arcticus]|uniref:ABC-type protease/lipase transport system fused ATPase/permease subunit n=1 Tax=Dyadobacter arcticus TaxID=1078754 RepID=A0ABX0USD8_9BACT|nr:hypothetical protein [Dyadobacter arcticus]NIJ55864.1 ABC-type protease/lipase transport system fused ATPase/permease subunit [Dyadobacter arcticus]